MTTRRNMLLALGVGPLAALPAFAQQEKRVRRIGYISGSTAQSNATWLAAFREGMAALRWVEGRDYVIDARYANGYADGVAQDLSDLAAAAVASQPDLLMVSTESWAHRLIQNTKTIPIVFVIGQDPLGAGVAASLQRPGGNATGLTSLGRDLAAKRLQLLKEAFPRITRVVLLFEPANRSNVSEAKEIEKAAPRLGIRITPIALRQPADIESAFNRGASLGAQAYIVTQGAVITAQRQVIADGLLRSKAPAIFVGIEYVVVGGLMSYGPSFDDNYRRAATYVDKILKGAKPGDLPIEQPAKFELVLNLKTAKAMGIKFPQSVLVRADRVIE
jgi:putative ABC transport system substrate-binding protein